MIAWLAISSAVRAGVPSPCNVKVLSLDSFDMERVTEKLGHTKRPILVRGALPHWKFASTASQLVDEFGDAPVHPIMDSHMTSPAVVLHSDSTMSLKAYTNGIVAGSLANAYIFENVTASMRPHVPELRDLADIYLKTMQARHLEYKAAPAAADQVMRMTMGVRASGNSWHDHGRQRPACGMQAFDGAPIDAMPTWCFAFACAYRRSHQRGHSRPQALVHPPPQRVGPSRLAKDEL
eukprot:5105914-Prymnesium_polylepis.1